MILTCSPPRPVTGIMPLYMGKIRWHTGHSLQGNQLCVSSLHFHYNPSSCSLELRVKCKKGAECSKQKSASRTIHYIWQVKCSMVGHMASEQARQLEEGSWANASQLRSLATYFSLNYFFSPKLSVLSPKFSFELLWNGVPCKKIFYSLDKGIKKLGQVGFREPCRPIASSFRFRDK